MKRLTLITAGSALLLFFTSGCVTMDNLFTPSQKTHQANSLFKYLYANDTGHIDRPSVPVLSLPLRVGIAFVPDASSDARYRNEAPLSEAKKVELMRKISEQFKALPFVKSIEFIPTTYLTPQGGFENLDQIRTMYDIDVVTLISYDQVQFTDRGFWSIGYWTVVGLYVVEGEKNDTRTMLDAAVYDIASRKMLFRAPGISTVKSTATPVNVTEELRLNRDKGFDESATNLVTGLQLQLDEFKNRIRSSPDEYKVVHKPGYSSGAGAFSPMEVALLGSAGVCFLCFRRKNERP